MISVQLQAFVIVALLTLPATAFAQAEQTQPDDAGPQSAEATATEPDADAEEPQDEGPQSEPSVKAVEQSQSEPAAPIEPAAQPPPSPVTLQEYLQSARANAAVLDEHQARIDAAKWRKYRAKWAWAPKVRSETALAPVPSNADPDAFGSNVDEFLKLDIGPYIREKIGVVVPLYTFGRISTAKALAEVGVDSERVKLEKAERNLEYEVRRAYYSVQLAASFEELLGEGGTLIKDQLHKMEEDREFGEADFDIKDFRKLQIFDAEVDSRVLDNAQLRGIATAGLNYFTGREGKAVVSPIDEEAAVESLPTVAQAIAAATESRPDLALLDQAVKARALQLKLQKREVWPNLFLAAELSTGWSTEELAKTPVCRKLTADTDCVNTDDLFAQPFSDSLNFFSFGIALGLRWEFDFFQHRGKIRTIKAQNDEVLAQRRRAVGAIHFEIEKIWTDADIARQKVEVTGRRLDAARRWRDQFGFANQAGGADIEDAVDPLKAYFEARALHLQARYDYLVARAALAEALGISDLSSLNSEPATASEDR